MKKLNYFGYEKFECSKCGSSVDEFDKYCQVCGHRFKSIQDEVIIRDSEKDDETTCIVIGAQMSDVFIFTQLKIDLTPKHLLNLPIFQGQRMFAEANPYEFYVFKTDKYSFITQGSQINLNLDNYDSFCTNNGYTIHFDKSHFSQLEIIELRTYTFG